MLDTRLCKLMGIEYPIVCAPMGPDITGPELAAAVSNAGGLGLMQAQLHPPPLLRQQIHRIRDLTDKPFGVNFILNFPCEDGVGVCLEEHVPVLSFFWGDPSPYLERAHAVGVKVLHQVGSVKAAAQAAQAGVDVVAPTPVVAAGGIADARGLVAALALGAEGAVLGTRFLATPEANAHPIYKQKLTTATEDGTVRTILFGHGWPNAPHRALRTAFVEEWLGREERAQESRPDEPLIGETRIASHKIPLQRFMGFPPNAEASGDIESMGLLAGQSVGLVHEIKPAAMIVQELVEGARRIISERLNAIPSAGSSGVQG